MLRGSPSSVRTRSSLEAPTPLSITDRPLPAAPAVQPSRSATARSTIAQRARDDGRPSSDAPQVHWSRAATVNIATLDEDGDGGEVEPDTVERAASGSYEDVDGSSSCSSVATTSEQHKEQSLFLALEAIIQADVAVKAARTALEEALGGTDRLSSSRSLRRASDRATRQAQHKLQKSAQSPSSGLLRINSSRKPRSTSVSIRRRNRNSRAFWPSQLQPKKDQPGVVAKVANFMALASSGSSGDSSSSSTTSQEDANRILTKDSDLREDELVPDNSWPISQEEPCCDSSSIGFSQEHSRQRSGQSESLVNAGLSLSSTSAHLEGSSLGVSRNARGYSLSRLHPPQSTVSIHANVPLEEDRTRSSSDAEPARILTSDWNGHRSDSPISSISSSPRLDAIASHGDVIPRHLLDSSGDYLVLRPNEKVRLVQLSEDAAEDDEAQQMGDDRAWSSSSEDEQPASKNRSSLGRISEEVERCEGDSETREADSAGAEGNERVEQAGASCMDVPSTPLRGSSPSNANAESHASPRSGSAQPLPLGQKVQPTPPATTVLTSMIKSALGSAAGQSFSANHASPSAKTCVQDQSPRLWQRKTWLSTPTTSPVSRRARSRSSSDLVQSSHRKELRQDEGSEMGGSAASPSTADLGRLVQSRWSSSTSNWDLSDSHAGFQLRSDLSRDLALGRSPNRPGELVDISASREQEPSLHDEEQAQEQEQDKGTSTPSEHGTKASSQFDVPPPLPENHLPRSHLSSLTPSVHGSMGDSEVSTGYDAARRSSSDDYRASSVLPLRSLGSKKSIESGERRSVNSSIFDQPRSTAANAALEDPRQKPLPTPFKKLDSACRTSSPTEDTAELLGRFPSVPVDGQQSSSTRSSLNAAAVAASAAAPLTPSISTPTSWLGRKIVKAASAVSGRRSSEPSDTVTSPGLAAAMQIGKDSHSVIRAETFGTPSDRETTTSAAAKPAIKGSRLLDIIRKDGGRRAKGKVQTQRGSSEAVQVQPEPNTSPTTTKPKFQSTRSLEELCPSTVSVAEESVSADVSHQTLPRSASAAAATCLATPASYESLLDEPSRGKGRQRAVSRASCTCTDANEEFRSAKGSIHAEAEESDFGRQSVEKYEQLPSLDVAPVARPRRSESETHSSVLAVTSPVEDEAQSQPRTSGLTHRSSTNSCYGLKAERKDGSALSEHSKESRSGSNSPVFTKSSLDSLRSATRSRVHAVKGSKVLLGIAKAEEKQAVPPRVSKAPSPTASPFIRATSLRGLREKFGGGLKPATLGKTDEPVTIHQASDPFPSPAACSSSTVILPPHAASDDTDTMSPQTSRLHDLGRGLGLGLNQSTTSLLQDIVEASKSPPSAAFPRSTSSAGAGVGLDTPGLTGLTGARTFRGGGGGGAAMSDVSTATSLDPQDWTPDKRHAFRKWLEAEGKGRGYFSPGGGGGSGSDAREGSG